MSRYRKLLLAITGSAILAVLGVSTSLAVPDHITSSQPSQNQGQPFHSEITATNHVTPSSNPCVLYEVALGNGVVKIGSASINVSFEAMDEILLHGRCFGTISGETTGYHFFTAANGDKLVAAQNVNFVGVQPDGTRLWAGTFRFSGGTGQFAGAVGEGDFTVTFRPGPNPPGTAIYDGEITLPDSTGMTNGAETNE